VYHFLMHVNTRNVGTHKHKGMCAWHAKRLKIHFLLENELCFFSFGGIKVMIRSYPRKSMIIFEFEFSRGTTRINHRRTRNKTKMEDATI